MSRFEGNIFELLSDENDDNKAGGKAAAAKPKKTADAAGPKGAKPKQAPAKGTSAPAAQTKKEEPKPKAPAANNKPVGATQAAAPQQPKQPAGQQQRAPRPPRPPKDAIPVIEAPPGEEGKPNRRNFENPKGKAKDAGRRALTSSQEGRQKQHPLERKSGTGRPPNELKKGGAGKFNVGNEKDELAVELDEAKAKEEAAKKERREKGAEEKKTDGPSADTIPEPTPEAQAPPTKKELDLSEYQKQQEQARGVLEAALKDFKKNDKERTPNEGSDDSAWSSYVALKREDEAVVSKKKAVPTSKKQAAPKEKPKIESVFSTDQSRKGPKGGKGKGIAGSPGKAKAQTPDVNDKNSFPALPQAPAAPAATPAAAASTQPPK